MCINSSSHVASRPILRQHLVAMPPGPVWNSPFTESAPTALGSPGRENKGSFLFVSVLVSGSQGRVWLRFAVDVQETSQGGCSGLCLTLGW